MDTVRALLKSRRLRIHIGGQRRPLRRRAFKWRPPVNGEHLQRSWRTARLSMPRYSLAATSVGDVALFAGGAKTVGPTWPRPREQEVSVVDIYNVTDGSWTTANLSIPRRNLTATSVGDVALFAGGTFINGSSQSVVDIYNVTDGLSTTAFLSQPRSYRQQAWARWPSSPVASSRSRRKQWWTSTASQRGPALSYGANGSVVLTPTVLRPPLVHALHCAYVLLTSHPTLTNQMTEAWRSRGVRAVGLWSNDQ
jgi:hypothetical protein